MHPNQPMPLRDPKPLESNTPDKPTEDMIQGIPPEEEPADDTSATKPAAESRTNIAGFVIILLNAAALAFLGVTVDTTAIVDAVAAAQWVHAFSALLGVLVIVYRTKATKLVRGVFSRS